MPALFLLRHARPCGGYPCCEHITCTVRHTPHRVGYDGRVYRGGYGVRFLSTNTLNSISPHRAVAHLSHKGEDKMYPPHQSQHCHSSLRSSPCRRATQDSETRSPCDLCPLPDHTLRKRLRYRESGAIGDVKMVGDREI